MAPQQSNKVFISKREHVEDFRDGIREHSDVELREELKNIWNENNVCVRETCMCSYLQHADIMMSMMNMFIVKIRMRECDRNSIGEL